MSSSLIIIRVNRAQCSETASTLDYQNRFESQVIDDGKKRDFVPFFVAFLVINQFHGVGLRFVFWFLSGTPEGSPKVV